MSIPATRLFQFLERSPMCAFERREINYTEFNRLRRAVRRIVQCLVEDEGYAREVGDRLRAHLSEWLTVPVPFESCLLQHLEDLGDPSTVVSRWGKDIAVQYTIAREAAELLGCDESPMRTQLARFIGALRHQGQDLRIFCHRAAVPHFTSLNYGPERLDPSVFIHSIADYRNLDLFDVLIKVGPLRSHGWGMMPDAILASPRFSRLAQFVWTGCSDDADFVYDPFAGPTEQQQTGATPVGPVLPGGVSWSVVTTQSGEPAVAGDLADLEELRLFRDIDSANETHPAVFVQIDPGHCILHYPHSQVISLDRRFGPEGLAKRLPCDGLSAGMYLLRPLVDDLDLGGQQVKYGDYSRIWKARLEAERRRDPRGLVTRLRDQGLNLIHLEAALAHWCKPPSNVIPAPQQRRHFEILIDVLACADPVSTRGGSRRLPWWVLAWNEIGRSRGEASQAGMIEQELLEERVIALLREMWDEIRESLPSGSPFTVQLPPGKDLEGLVEFYRILAVEAGFKAPSAAMKTIMELTMVEGWRN